MATPERAYNPNRYYERPPADNLLEIFELQRPAWQKLGACAAADPELFYPPSVAAKGAYDQGRAICQECPVIAVCREYGMGEKYGLWGGLSPNDRRNLKEKQKRLGGRAD